MVGVSTVVDMRELLCLGDLARFTQSLLGRCLCPGSGRSDFRRPGFEPGTPRVLSAAVAGLGPFTVPNRYINLMRFSKTDICAQGMRVLREHKHSPLRTNRSTGQTEFDRLTASEPGRIAEGRPRRRRVDLA